MNNILKINIYTGLLFCSLLHLSSFGFGQHKTNKPNIVLILTDDQGYGDLSVHESPDVRTPNIDRLKSQSVSLEDFHVSPTCAPSRAGIMSGRVPFKGGVTHTILGRERLALGMTLLPEVMKRANYTTGIFGKWHLGDEDPYQPHNRGFDETFIHGAGGVGQNYPGDGGDVPGNDYQDPIIKHNNKFVRTKGFCTDVFFKKALSWMRSCQNQGNPFFAYIATNAPHSPFKAPMSYQKRFADLKYPRTGQGFYGMIENIDDNVGLLLKKLDEWKLSENTIVIYMSDNGRTKGPTNHKRQIYNAGMRGLKNTSYQGGTRVPFFMRWPSHIKAGTKVHSLFSHYDIMPTFAEIADINIKDIPNLDGESFLSYVKGEKTKATEKYRFIHAARWPGNPKQYIGYTRDKRLKGNVTSSNPQNHKYNRCAVRTQQYSFVNNKELYDIRKDPGQKNNIIDQHPKLISELRKEYDIWWDSMTPLMINETETLVKEQAFKKQYEKQLATEGIPDWKEPKLD